MAELYIVMLWFGIAGLASIISYAAGRIHERKMHERPYREIKSTFRTD